MSDVQEISVPIKRMSNQTLVAKLLFVFEDIFESRKLNLKERVTKNKDKLREIKEEIFKRMK